MYKKVAVGNFDIPFEYGVNLYSSGVGEHIWAETTAIDFQSLGFETYLRRGDEYYDLLSKQIINKKDIDIFNTVHISYYDRLVAENVPQIALTYFPVCEDGSIWWKNPNSKTIIAHQYYSDINAQTKHFTGHDYVIPFCPFSHAITNNPINNKTIFWTSKMGLHPDYSGKTFEIDIALFEWISSMLSNGFNLIFTTHFEQNSHESVKYSIVESDIYKKHLSKYEDKIIFLKNVNYSDMLEILGKSKIVINRRYVDNSFGGMPVEAAFYNIPTVVNGTSAFDNLKDKLYTFAYNPSYALDYVQYLDKLVSDDKYYTNYGSIYNSFINKYHGIEAFSKVVNHLFDVLYRK